MIKRPDGNTRAYLKGDAADNVLTSLGTPLSNANDSIVSYPAKATYVYQAAAAANVVVSATPAILVGMIIGADVGSAVIEVSDHASDGDGNVEIELTGSTLMTSCGGYVPVGAYFGTGIASDMTNQTDVTFIIIND
jgi:hypothetical protein